jgi:NADH dehydrogenase FAD-containing subunit
MNSQKIKEAIAAQIVDVRYNTTLKSIADDHVLIADSITGEVEKQVNDLVYIFAGGELPTQFLEKVGIKITKKFGDAILKHN